MIGACRAPAATETAMNPPDDRFEPLDAQLLLLAAGELPPGQARALQDRLRSA